MSDTVLIETTERLFAELCTSEALREAERDGWAPRMWARVAELGLAGIGLPEERGGQGGMLGDALAVLRIAGAYALPLPLAETGLAGRLLADAGLDVPSGPLTVVPGHPDDSLRLSAGRLSGIVHRVPWARAATAIVLLPPGGGRLAVVPAGAVSITPMTNLAGDPRDTVRFDDVLPETLAPTAADAETLLYRGALTRAVLMAGALRRVCELTVGYTRERVQFGRPLARFQAVQHHIVTVVEETALVGVAADAAARRAELDELRATADAARHDDARGTDDAARHDDARVAIATAKILAGEAVHTAVRSAHQAHGAMGVTQEYPLHHATRRLRAWRGEYGDEREWSARLGRIAEAAGADALYPLITAGSAPAPR